MLFQKMDLNRNALRYTAWGKLKTHAICSHIQKTSQFTDTQDASSHQEGCVDFVEHLNRTSEFSQHPQKNRPTPTVVGRFSLFTLLDNRITPIDLDSFPDETYKWHQPGFTKPAKKGFVTSPLR